MSATPNSQKEAQKKRSAVQPDELIAHLRILAVFHKLKLDVQGRSPHNPTGLWTAFLGYAVEKFASWITNVVDKDDGKSDEELRDDEFPTLDVAMVWHAYILNPLEYHKDCQKSYSGLMRIKAFPVTRLADVIDTLGLEPRFPVPAFGSRGVRIGPQFSLDLVAAVKRQASFVAQVAAVGWTQRPRGIQDVANSCIDKYHVFLKKLWENPNHLAVPTLEIDLAWHTHQLNIEQYRNDSMMLFGRILQHDDDIPSPELNKAFKRNSYDWQNLFHMDYSSGSICTGFRPVSLTVPGTPNGSKRPSSMTSSRTNSEISLQELYQAVSEKRLSVGADGSSRASSSSTSTPSVSGRESSPSPVPSFQSLSPASRPSSAGNDSPPRIDNMMQMLRPSNDSTVTISPRPPSRGQPTPTQTLPDSRRSSTSELGSIFAYTPPTSWSDPRGTFDRPPASYMKPSSPIAIARRPSSAGNSLPTKSALRRPKHQLSSSTGSLYAPGMPSPLGQPPETNLPALNESTTQQSSPQPIRRPSVVSRIPSQEKVPTSSIDPSGTAIGSTPSYSRRPSSSGNGASRVLPVATVSKRPSTASGLSVGGKPIGGPMKLSARGSMTPLPTASEMGSMTYPSRSSSKRPSTAPLKGSTVEADGRPQSRGLFRKKSKDERSPSKKRSWYRFW